MEMFLGQTASFKSPIKMITKEKCGNTLSVTELYLCTKPRMLSNAELSPVSGRDVSANPATKLDALAVRHDLDPEA